MSDSGIVEVLTSRERRRLDQLEKIIGTGLDTLLDVGRALAEIHDQRLYRSTHNRFADYLRDRWNIGQTRGYQLIDLAAVSTVVEVRNEAQARVLAPVMRKHGSLAVKQAFDSISGELTAPKLERAVAALDPDVLSEPPDEPHVPPRSLDTRLPWRIGRDLVSGKTHRGSGDGVPDITVSLQPGYDYREWVVDADASVADLIDRVQRGDFDDPLVRDFALVAARYMFARGDRPPRVRKT